MSQNNMNYSGASFTRTSNQSASSKNYVKDETVVSNLSDFSAEDYKTFKFSRVSNAASKALFKNAIESLRRDIHNTDFSLENIGNFLFKKINIPELSDLFDARILECELDKNIIEKIYEKLENTEVKQLIADSTEKTIQEIEDFRSAIDLIRTHIDEYNGAVSSLTTKPDESSFNERMEELSNISHILKRDLESMSRTQRIIYSLRELHFHYYRGYFMSSVRSDRNTSDSFNGTTNLHNPVSIAHNDGHYNIEGLASKRDIQPNSIPALESSGDLIDLFLRCSVITSILRRAAGVARLENSDEGRARNVSSKLPIDSITGGTDVLYTTEDKYPNQSIGKYFTVKKSKKETKFRVVGRDTVALLEPTSKAASSGIPDEYLDLDDVNSSMHFFKDVLHDPINHKMDLFSEYLSEMGSYVNSSKDYIEKLTCADQEGSIILPHVLFKRVLEDFQKHFSLLAERATLREVTANFFTVQNLEDSKLFELVRNRVAQLLLAEDISGAEVEKSAFYSSAITDRGKLGNAVTNTRRALDRDPEHLQAIIDGIQSKCFDISDPFNYGNHSGFNCTINILRSILSNAGELDADDRSSTIGISMRNLLEMGQDVNSDLNIINMIAKLYIEIEKECSRIANLDSGNGDYFSGAVGRARGTRIKFSTILYQLCVIYKKMTTFGSLEPIRLRNDPEYSPDGQLVQGGLFIFMLADIGDLLNKTARTSDEKTARDTMTQFYNDDIRPIAMRLGYDFSHAKNFSTMLDYILPAIGEMKPDSIDLLFDSSYKIPGTNISKNSSSYGLSFRPAQFSKVYHYLVRESNGAVKYLELIKKEIDEYKLQTESMVSLSEKFNASGEDASPIRKLYEAKKFDKYLKTTSDFAVNNLDYRLDRVSEVVLNNQPSMDVNLSKFVKFNFLNMISSSETERDDGGTFIHVLGLESGKLLSKSSDRKNIKSKGFAKIKTTTDNLFFYTELKSKEEYFEKQIRISVDETSLVNLLKKLDEDGETFENLDSLIPKIKFRTANDMEFLGNDTESKAALGINSSNLVKKRLKTVIQDFITQKALEILYGLEFNSSLVSKSSIENTNRSIDALPIMCEAVKIAGGDDSIIKELYTIKNGNLIAPTLEKQIQSIKPYEEQTPDGIVIKSPKLTEEHLMLAGLLYSTKIAYTGMLEKMLLSPAVYDEIFFIRTKMNNLVGENMFDLSRRAMASWPTAQHRGIQTNSDKQIASKQIMDMITGVDYTSRTFYVELKDL